MKIWYPHMWRYRWFHRYHVCLLNWIVFIGVSSKHLRVFLGSLRRSSETFGNSRKMFENVRLAFGTIFENLRKSSESGRKSSENHQKRRHQFVYIIKRTLHVSSKIWTLCSRSKNNIPLVRSFAALTREILFFISYILRFLHQILRCEKAFRILLRPIREAKRVSHTWKNRFVQSQTTV